MSLLATLKLATLKLATLKLGGASPGLSGANAPESRADPALVLKSSVAMPCVGMLLLLSRCIAGESRSYPLYPPRDPPPGPQQVARLTGYVKSVDGKDVSEHGASFELLPGCHVVKTPGKWGSMTTTGGVIVTTGELVFALPMRAAHQYVIQVETGAATGPTGSAAVVGYEKDARGNTRQRFNPATSVDDIRLCQEEAAAPVSAP